MLFSLLICGPYKRISIVFKLIILIVVPKMYKTNSTDVLYHAGWSAVRKKMYILIYTILEVKRKHIRVSSSLPEYF